MEHDAAMRAAARAIYEEVYPSEEWTPVPFADAERFGTVHYRQSVAAARHARLLFASSTCHQLMLL